MPPSILGVDLYKADSVHLDCAYCLKSLRRPVVTGLLVDHRNWPFRRRELNSVSRTSGVFLLRCQGPRKGEAGNCLNIASTLLFERVQQKHLCETNVPWRALAAKCGDPYLEN